jgi:hypothetical protein
MSGVLNLEGQSVRSPVTLKFRVSLEQFSRRYRSEVPKTSEAVEKLTREKFAEIGSRQGALQTIFSTVLDIFCLLIFRFARKADFFNSLICFWAGARRCAAHQSDEF